MKRLYYLDWLRVFAIIGVICIHSADYFLEDMHILNTWNYFIEHFGRFGVPCFVMISGILFLNRDISIKKLYSKYILRLCICIFFWYMLFSLLHRPFLHLWYLPMIICIYIVYPIFKQIIKNDYTILYYIVLAFIVVFILPWIDKLPDLIHFINNTFELTFPCQNITSEFIYFLRDKRNFYLPMGFTIYFVLGYYLNKINIKNKYKILFYILGLLSFIIGLLLTCYVSIKTKTYTDKFAEQFITAFFYSVAIFVLFKSVKFFNKENKIIVFFSKHVFGIYLVHWPILSFISKCFGDYIIQYPILLLLKVFVVFAISLVISIVLNKIPIVNKWLV